MPYCRQCGEKNPQDAAFCISCGAKAKVTSTKSAPSTDSAPKTQLDAPRKKKNASLAAILSFLIAGLGHFYLGEWKRGALWFILLIIISIVLFYTLNSAGTFIGLILNIICGLDARKIAVKKYS